MRVCIAYDCLYPFTVGGHERWLRQLAESLAAAGHEVTFLTRLQWPLDEPPAIPGVRVVAVSPREELYDAAGNRRTGPPLRFGLGVGGYLARHRRDFDVVHTCSFPYFHLPALRLALAFARVPVTVDWPEVWSRAYWRRYSGLVAGSLGEAVQRLCILLTPTAVVYSRTHGDRLTQLGFRGRVVRPGGLGPDAIASHQVALPASPIVLFAARHIREKRPSLVVSSVAIARGSVPGLSALILGEGPETPALRALIASLDAEAWVSTPGFVSRAEVESALGTASVMLLPSEREGFGIVVLEAASYGTPVVVVPGPDNAAVELIVEGVNGFVAASSSPADVAAALLSVLRGGSELRTSTADWYAESAPRLASSVTATTLAELFLLLPRQLPQRTDSQMSETASAVTKYDRDKLSEAQRFVVGLVGSDRSVLEMGANTGYVSRALHENGCHVTATDYDRKALPKLSEAADLAMWCDLHDLDSLAQIEDHRYDVVIFGDVLEHLIDPEPALAWAIAHLSPGGRIVVSLPNIAHWTIRLSLARGRFDMGPWGILDRTHLRFFTVASAEQLFATHGLAVRSRLHCNDPVQGLPWDRLLRGRALGLSRKSAPHIINRWPGALAYQVVWELERSA